MPQYTEEQKKEFIEICAVRKRRQIVTSMVIVIICFMMITAAKKGLGLPTNLIAPVFLALITGAVIFTIMNWRCPACKKYLGASYNPNFCPKCGTPLK